MTFRAQTALSPLQNLTQYPAFKQKRNDDNIAIVGIEHTTFPLLPQKEAS